MKKYIKSVAELIDYADYDDELGELVKISDNGQYRLYKSVSQITKRNIYTLVRDIDGNQYRWIVDMHLDLVPYNLTIKIVDVNKDAPLYESIMYLHNSLLEAYRFKEDIEKIIKENK